MQHHEFIAAVQQRAELASPGDAEIATRATLQPLTERLAGGLPENLGSQLPEELGRHLEQQGGGEAPDYGLTELLRRVAERHDSAVSREDAAARATVVLEVLDEAVEHDGLGRLRDQLPAEFEELLPAAG